MTVGDLSSLPLPPNAKLGATSCRSSPTGSPASGKLPEPSGAGTGIQELIDGKYEAGKHEGIGR
jgi:hypothetical protein